MAVVKNCCDVTGVLSSLGVSLDQSGGSLCIVPDFICQ